ncbi:Cell division suppressor protein YneA [compost metagenome]
MMLRYSTYNSIYETTSVRVTPIDTWRDRLKGIVPRPLVKKLMWVLLLLIVGGSGMIHSFANSAGDHQEVRNLIVQSGDTLWEIAVNEKPNNMDTRVYIKELKQLNGMSNGNIMAGDVLMLPSY